MTDGANPVPMTKSRVLGGPLVCGANRICGITVNKSEALLIPSSAVTGYVPFGSGGTLKLALKDPNQSVNGGGEDVTSVSLNIRVMGLTL